METVKSPFLYISIDFSLESTGVTFYDGIKYHFLSFINSVEKQTKERINLLKSSLKNPSDLTIKTFERNSILAVKNRTDGLYGWEKEHMTNVTFYGNLLANEIRSIIKKHYESYSVENTTILIENYSYSSMSDTLIQLVENTMSLKKELFGKKICKIENFYCIPAPRVKQYVGKGNYDKFQMTDAFVKNIKDDIILKSSNFFSFLCDNLKDHFIKERIKKGNQFFEILSPISDIVDSYWILSYFINIPIKKQIGK